MKKFFLFSIAYMAVALSVVALTRDYPATQIRKAAETSLLQLQNFAQFLPYLAIGLAAFFLLTRSVGGIRVLREAGWALAACIVFSAAFSFLKTSIPYVVPFWADPALARIDKMLHFGTDPWVWAHEVGAQLSAEWVSVLYLAVWGIPAVFFPVFLAVLDQDQQRVQRFLVLYAVVWIGLGNVVAGVFASVGPVYFDRLEGVARFHELNAALLESGVASSSIGSVQDGLWQLYTDYAQVAGSGISAFPSVHNGVATLLMLYMIERSKWLAPVGVGFCAAILFCSVYIGWHYAIDGYFSILAISALWFAQRKWSLSERRNVAFATYTPA